MPKYDIHELKTWPEYYEQVMQRKKNFEVRKNDRDFKVGDLLYLKEYSPESGYTGRETGRFITYILDNPDFVKEGHVILSF